MSVLIKGMEMPKSCIECPCLRHDSIDGKNAYQCNVTLEKFDIHGLPCSERDETCPLDHFREVTKNDVPDANVRSSSETPNSSDLVSRRAVLNLIRIFEFPNIERMKHYRLRYIDPNDVRELPPAQPEQRWIPCSERLPEEKDAGRILKKLGTEKRSDYVLATVEVKGERMTVSACTYDGKWDWNMKYAFPDFNVVAWMPLPEPYKGGEKDG